MRPLKFFRVVLITNSTLAAYANAQNREAKQDTMNQTPAVVFVCEHGSAKSVVLAFVCDNFGIDEFQYQLFHRPRVDLFRGLMIVRQLFAEGREDVGEGFL